MDVRRWPIVLVVAVAAGAVGCVEILGLDQGKLEDSDASAAAGDPDASPVGLDAIADHAAGPEEASARGDAGAPDVANDHSIRDAALGSDATDAAPLGTDAACAYTTCPNGCWDTANDPMHCGSCTKACPYGANSQATCTAGVCGQACLHGYVDCAGQPCSCGGAQICLSNDTCGSCRAALQPCQVGSDCCSGSCGATLTCL